jgi:outer membrane immunogenic protein
MGAAAREGEIMKKLLLASAALAALSIGAPAVAADLPAEPAYKAPLPPLPIYDWTGFYVGVNAGYSWGQSKTNLTLTGVPFSGTEHMNGWVAGGQAGYNWQVNANWLIGIEADIDATGQKDTLNAATAPACTTAPVPGVPATTTTCTTNTASFGQKLLWFATARARLGFLPMDHLLLYVTGGAAFGEVETDASVGTTTTIATTFNGVTTAGPTTVATAVTSANNQRFGWTVGGGAEWVLSGPWTGKVEYLHVDLGNFGNTFSAGGVPFLVANSHFTDNIVRVGLNYRFGGPVVARY